MDLDAVLVFVRVVDTGSFSAAAKLLKMPKTTVSAKVAALEKRLGVTLLQRTTRKLHVTEGGQRYYQHCARAVEELELGESALMSTRSRPSGLLRVTVPIDIGHTLLPVITRAYLDRYEDVRVEMILSNRVADLIGEGIDLAIRAGSLKDSSMIAKPFRDLTIGLWAAPHYLKAHGTPARPEELALHHFVSYAGMKSLRLWNGKVEVDIPVTGRVIADDSIAIKAMLALEGGIGLLPDFLAADAHRSGALVPVLDGWRLAMVSGFSFVYPGQKYTSPKVQAFIDTALQVIAEQPTVPR
ncbi:LysR family transcriptional regulator [Massilia sp. METH4]|uniref:LysR family transcriptional regulator n=1 Tax=Massilia sp. METH4 TaxID=3123041 RepID=UPI0030D447E2